MFLSRVYQEEIINTLKEYHPDYIGIFGSYARGEAGEKSDVDILVKFKEPKSLLKIIDIENRLSEELGVKVDLITEGAIKNPTLKERIFNDIQIVYQA